MANFEYTIDSVAASVASIPSWPIAGPVLTVTGVNGAIQSLDFVTSISSAVYVASLLLPEIDASVTSGRMIAALPENAPSVPPGTTGMLQVTADGLYVMGAGYSALVDSANAPITVVGGASDGQIVVAANGGLAFDAGPGTGTVVSGGGAVAVTVTIGGIPYPSVTSGGGGNAVIRVKPGAGVQNIRTGDGDDTIYALSGNNTIDAGIGRNQILSLGGNNMIWVQGNDLISAPSGSSTIIAGFRNAASMLSIFLGDGNSEVYDGFLNAGTHASIVVGGGAATVSSFGADQIWMQTGGGVVNSMGRLMHVLGVAGATSIASDNGPARNDTVIGGSGAMTVNAVAADDFVFAGIGALNFIGGEGASTILGNTAGSASITGGTGSVVAVAYGRTTFTGGAGAATVAAFGGGITIKGGTGTGLYVGAPGGLSRITQGTGQATMYGGGDGDIIMAGSVGGGILVAGTGSETLIGGAGADLFAMLKGNASNVVIQNFIEGQDFLSLSGFAADEATNALAASVLIAGSQQLTLSDGTKILFAGVTNVTKASFL